MGTGGHTTTSLYLQTVLESAALNKLKFKSSVTQLIALGGIGFKKHASGTQNSFSCWDNCSSRSLLLTYVTSR